MAHTADQNPLGQRDVGQPVKSQMRAVQKESARPGQPYTPHGKQLAQLLPAGNHRAAVLSGPALPERVDHRGNPCEQQGQIQPQPGASEGQGKALPASPKPDGHDATKKNADEKNGVEVGPKGEDGDQAPAQEQPGVIAQGLHQQGIGEEGEESEERIHTRFLGEVEIEGGESRQPDPVEGSPPPPMSA